MTSKSLLSEVAQSKVIANRLAKSLPLNDLQRAINNLQSAATKIQKSESEKATKVRSTNLKKIKSMMADLGLTTADLTSATAKTAPKRGRPKKAAAKTKRGPKKGRKVAPKYALKVANKTHQWTGRGRMPLVFKNHIESGKSLESCLIKKPK